MTIITGRIGVNVREHMRLVATRLYDKNEVAIRELVQNAYDAVKKVREWTGDGSGTQNDVQNAYDAVKKVRSRRDRSPGRIDLRTDARNSILEVFDDGVGMDERELEHFLSTVGESSKRLADEPTIGEFGIGFFSAFMIADNIEVTTRKGKEGETLVWKSVDKDQYSIERAIDGDFAPGTRVRLYLCSNAADFGGVEKIKRIISRYCNYLDCPIHVNDSKEPHNTRRFLWELSDKPAQGRWLRELLGFDPPFWHLGRNESGDDTTQFCMYLAEEEAHQHLFSRRMFVADNVNLIDDLKFVGVILDSPSLLLTLDRGNVKWDDNTRALMSSISSTIEQWLPRLAAANGTDKRLARIGKRHQQTFRHICLNNRDASKRLHALTYFDVAGTNEQMTVPQYVDRSSTRTQVFYVLAGHDGRAHSLQTSYYRQQGIPILRVADHDDEEVLRRICTSLDLDLTALGSRCTMADAEESDNVAFEHLANTMGAVLSKRIKLRAGPSHVPLFSEGDSLVLNPRNPFLIELSTLRVAPEDHRQLLQSLYEVFESLDSVELSERAEGVLIRSVMRAFEHWRVAFTALQQAGARLRRLEEPWWQPGQIGGHLSDTRAGRKTTCFLAFPFQPSYEDFKLIVRSTCQEYGVIATSAEAIDTRPLLEKVCACIQACDLAIVDITENNPNVLFEFGLLMARRKPVVITRSKKVAAVGSISVPADIVSIERIEYENFASDLRGKLDNLFSRLVGSRAP
jgi:molecular chaperone HtpG